MKFADAKVEEYVAPTPSYDNCIEVHNTRIVIFKCTPPLNQITGEPLWEEEPFARLALVPTQGAIQYGKQHIAYDTTVHYETPLISNSRLVLPTKRYKSLCGFKQKLDKQFPKDVVPQLIKNIESILPKTENISF
jgi:hypothetical protein